MPQAKNHLAILIPCYNESKVIRQVIKSLPKKLPRIKKISVIVINDGSSDESIFEIKKTKAILATHLINLGYGAATITGFEVAKKIESDIVITFDGDGQHDPKDIQRIISPILESKCDMTIGNRFRDAKQMPFLKRIGIKGLNTIIFFLSGRYVADSQSGLKAFSKKALNEMQLSTIGMEFSSELIMEASKRKLKIEEVPIKAIYSKYSKAKGQAMLNGVNIVVKLLFRRLGG